MHCLKSIFLQIQHLKEKFTHFKGIPTLLWFATSTHATGFSLREFKEALLLLAASLPTRQAATLPNRISRSETRSTSRALSKGIYDIFMWNYANAIIYMWMWFKFVSLHYFMNKSSYFSFEIKCLWSDIMYLIFTGSYNSRRSIPSRSNFCFPEEK